MKIQQVESDQRFATDIEVPVLVDVFDCTVDAHYNMGE